MKQYNLSIMNLKKGALLGLAIALGSGAVATTVGTQSAYAATAPNSSAVYKQFQKYLQQPSQLIQARNYLINHIDEAGVWYATLMTLQLENAQKAELSDFADKLYPDNVQKAIGTAFSKNGLTYTGLLKAIKDPKIRVILIEGRDKGYKMQTTEGMYYPVMHYEGYKGFKPYIKQDIASYIDIMAKESNRPSTNDAAISISWDEVISRTLAMESFVQKYPTSNRIATVKKELTYAVSRLFYGTDNTPAYDYDQKRLDPELRQAYEDALNKGIGNSKLLATIKKLLAMLDSTENEFTPAVEKFLKNEGA